MLVSRQHIMETKNKKENKEKTIVLQKRKKVLSGVVTSTKMQKTIVVLVKRYVKHPKYDKYRLISKKYKADNQEGEYQVGEQVKIEECRPLSKDKRFRVIK